MKLTPEQFNSLAMNGYAENGELTRQPDQVNEETGVLAYERDGDDDTLLIIYPTGGTAVMSRQMNLPEGIV